MFKDDSFRLKIEWAFYVGWTVKIIKSGCDSPIVKVNCSDIRKAMEQAQNELIEYLESRR